MLFVFYEKDIVMKIIVETNICENLNDSLCSYIHPEDMINEGGGYYFVTDQTPIQLIPESFNEPTLLTPELALNHLNSLNS